MEIPLSGPCGRLETSERGWHRTARLPSADIHAMPSVAQLRNDPSSVLKQVSVAIIGGSRRWRTADVGTDCHFTFGLGLS